MDRQSIRFKDSGIFYTTYKNQNKPKLVLLHSYGSSSLVFDGIIPNLKKLFELIIIDLPSHGKSEHSKNVGIVDMPEILLAIFNKENIEKAHFIGVSEGSLIAQAFEQIYNNKVQSLISISSHSIFYDSYKVIHSENWLTNIKLLFLRIFSFKRYKKYYIEKSAKTTQGKALFAKSMETLKKHTYVSRKEKKRFYNLGKPKINYSTYIVCGNEDLNIIKDASIQYEQKTPKSILEGYADCKQVVFLDNPRLFVDRVKSFISSVDSEKKNDK